jgi:hypothetical protein
VAETQPDTEAEAGGDQGEGRPAVSLAGVELVLEGRAAGGQEQAEIDIRFIAVEQPAAAKGGGSSEVGVFQPRANPKQRSHPGQPRQFTPIDQLS